MSNSPLVNYTKISPNKNSPRNKPIDTITIHCTAGNKDNTAKQIADYFSNASRGASCNYVVGGDGSIAISVEEKDRSWCTSSSANDNRAITIEVCSNIAGTEVNDKAYAALINLVADICKRNGIKKLNFTGNKSGNLTMHKWFAATACPGPYLESKFPYIASEVNKRLNAGSEKPSTGVLYRVQTGAFKNKANADALLTKVKAKGFDTYMIQDGGLYKVQVGAYSNKANADAQAAKLKAVGFDTYITTKSGAAVTSGVTKKSVTEIAREVIAGKWGNGVERINKLKAAGYNSTTIQNEVNKLLKK